MKKLLLLLLIAGAMACEFKAENPPSTVTGDGKAQKDSIYNILEEWHAAAADANFEAYFNLMARDGVFIGTDAIENWQNEKFREYARPHFEKGKAWSFSTLERNIYTSEKEQLAWFDELLDTQMGICRGSGVLEKTKEGWKIKHYVLSIAIPNEFVPEITAMKREYDEKLISEIKNSN